MQFDTIMIGDALTELKKLPDGITNCCVTSPPYWGLRDYGIGEQLGLEPTPEEYVSNMVEVFREVHRVLRDDGTLWLNLGDSYAGSTGQTGGQGLNTYQKIGGATDKMLRPSSIEGLKSKNLIGIPWRVAFALQADGWWLRSDIIWHKPNPMPESVTDRPTKAHEYIFLLSKSQQYYYDHEAIKEPAVGSTTGPAASFRRHNSQRNHALCPNNTPTHRTDREDVRYDGPLRNKRSVWKVATKPFPEAHFATFPEQLIEPCILAGSPLGGVVLDPFMGSGTTAVVAKKLTRRWIGVELNPEYAEMAQRRIGRTPYSLFAQGFY